MISKGWIENIENHKDVLCLLIQELERAIIEQDSRNYIRFEKALALIMNTVSLMIYAIFLIIEFLQEHRLSYIKQSFRPK